MKKSFLLLVMVVFYYCSHGQVKDYNVVFDMSSGDSISHQAVIRQVSAIKNGNPDAKLEVVIFGQGLNLVLKDKSQHIMPIQKLLGMKDVSFKVCSMTMKRNNADKSQLIPGVEVVPDGIYEIVTKQKDGWGYIKVAQ